VAVIQLSKIQHRRGQKNTGSGLPQLASAELGWAIDTRELYIGNGAVSEGAPAVGNTKILTEYDDLFSLANTYSYRSPDSFLTGSNSSAPVERTLQERLDDTVSVRAFGAAGDGVKDDTAALQRAIDQIYLSSSKGNPSNRIQLHFEAGTYKITDTLYVPPHATLIGAGSDKSVLELDSDTAKPVIKTVNDSSTPGDHAGIESSTFINQPRNITIHGFTLVQSTKQTGLLLEACRDSVFEDIKIEGTWIPTENSFPIAESAIRLEALSGAVLSDSNSFRNCKLQKFSWGVRSDWDVKHNNFDSCVFVNLGYGVALGLNVDTNPYDLDNEQLDKGTGKVTGPRRNTVSNNEFKDISRQGIWIRVGSENLSQNNSFTSVGNNQAIETDPVVPVILFETHTNVSDNDWFSRTASLIDRSLTDVPYIPEIEGAVSYELSYEQQVNESSVQNIRIFRLPGYQNQTYELDYTITSESDLFIRSGIMQLTMLEAPPPDEDDPEYRIEITDDYSFVGDNSLDGIEFSASLEDYGTYQNPSPAVDTIAVRATSSVDNWIMRFTIRAKKTRIG
jgi:parallel beta-helix repeat protein